MTANDEYKKLLPSPDNVSREFFEGVKRHELLIQQCVSCEKHMSPGRMQCPLCWSRDLKWVKAKGTGKIYTFAVMHQKYHPGWEEDIPYNFGIVELDEGVRLHTNFVEIANDQLKVNLPVEVIFSDVTPDVTLHRFKPVK